MKRRHGVRYWSIVSNPKYPFSDLDLSSDAPARHEGARQCSVDKMDRQRVVDDAADAARRDRPADRTAVFVKPTLHLIEPLAEATGRNSNPNAHGETPLGLLDDPFRAGRHRLHATR